MTKNTQGSEWEEPGLTNALIVADKIMDILEKHGISPMAVKELVVMINEILKSKEASSNQALLQKVREMVGEADEIATVRNGRGGDLDISDFSLIQKKEVLTKLAELEKEHNV